MNIPYKSKPSLVMLFDGDCPLCLREINFLKSLNSSGHLGFVDISSNSYKPEEYSGITYRMAMSRMHALKANGDLLLDLDVFREAYKLVGFGWIYAPSRWPVFSIFLDGIYLMWIRIRLPLTGRPSLNELCESCIRK